MNAPPLAKALPAVLLTLAACTEPQTPVSDGAGTPPGTTAPVTTAAPTMTAVPTGASSVTDAPTATATATAPSASGPAEKLTPPYVLTFRQSGGIAGMLMETVIDTGARSVTYGGLRNQKPETMPLTAEDIATITRSLEEARFASFPGKIKGGVVADGFTYTFTLKAGGKEYTVSWEDGSVVPEPYSALRNAVNSVRASKFGGTSPKSAPTM